MPAALGWLSGRARGSFHSTLDASSLGVPVLHGLTSFMSAAQRFGWTVYQPRFSEVWKINA